MIQFTLLFILFMNLSLLFCHSPIQMEEIHVEKGESSLYSSQEVCNRILEMTSSEQATRIIINQQRGGMGHKSISTANGIVYALLTKKQLFCIVVD